MENGRSDRDKASTSTDSVINNEQNDGNGGVPKKEGKSSQVCNVELQLALDEALALSLQEMENGRSDRDKASTSTDFVINNEQNDGNGRVPKKEGESSQVCNVELQLALDEALALSLQEMENGRSDRDKASTSTDSVINNEQNDGNGRVPKQEGESSQVCNVESQLALDEALALSLQEMENVWSDKDEALALSLQEMENVRSDSDEALALSLQEMENVRSDRDEALALSLQEMENVWSDKDEIVALSLQEMENVRSDRDEALALSLQEMENVWSDKDEIVALSLQEMENVRSDNDEALALSLQEMENVRSDRDETVALSLQEMENVRSDMDEALALSLQEMENVWSNRDEALALSLQEMENVWSDRDEALALSLQEMENQLGSVSLGETSGTQGGNIDVNTSGSSGSSGISVQAVTEDNVNMTYEELQSLGESIGTESKGLSDELISKLPSVKYKIGFFSKKENHDQCVICCMEYKNRDVLTILPCQHQYHSECVTKWLKLNKKCPVCKKEVFGS